MKKANKNIMKNSLKIKFLKNIWNGIRGLIVIKHSSDPLHIANIFKDTLKTFDDFKNKQKSV